MKSSRRWNRLSKTTRRKIEKTVAAMHRRDAAARRVDRAWRPVRPNAADLTPEPAS